MNAALQTLSDLSSGHFISFFRSVFQCVYKKKLCQCLLAMDSEYGEGQRAGGCSQDVAVVFMVS